MQVAAWYRGRQITSGRQKTTSEGDFGLLGQNQLCVTARERTVWTRDADRKIFRRNILDYRILLRDF